MRTLTRCLLTTVAMALFAATASAQVPRLMNYQGVLDSAGAPVPDATRSVTFTIYDAEAGGAAIWTETQDVSFTGGGFDALLGGVSALEFGNGDADRNAWLEVSVGGEALSPRTRLVSAPFSFASQTVRGDIAGGSPSVVWFGNGDADRSYVEVRADEDSTVATFDHYDGVTGALLTSFRQVGNTLRATQTIAKYDPLTGSPISSVNFEADTAGSYIIMTYGDDTTMAFGNGDADFTGSFHLGGTLEIGNSISIDGIDDKITATGGLIDFDDENLVTSGKAAFGPGCTNEGLWAFAMGNNCEASEHGATVGGGEYNVASAGNTTIGGGASNSALQYGTTVGGGQSNEASGLYAFVGGGSRDTASGDNSAVGGGDWNHAAAYCATASGGRWNYSANHTSTVCGGDSNSATGVSSTACGGSRNVASGYYSTTLGGDHNVARGYNTVAAGHCARANHNGSVVVAASTNNNASDSTRSGCAGQMVLRASQGLYITDAAEEAPCNSSDIISTKGGAYCSGDGTTWVNGSDRNLKENFAPVDGAALLKKIAALDIEEWNYKSEPEDVRHIGPVAQDFYALFGLGGDDKSISTVDPSGIALAAIQELHRKTCEIDELRAELTELKRLVEQLTADRR